MNLYWQQAEEDLCITCNEIISWFYNLSPLPNVYSLFSQEAMETIRAEHVADVVSNDLSQASCNTFSLKNAGIRTSCSRLWERLAAHQESSAALAEQVDQLKRKAENTDREFEKFKKKQQEEYNKLCEHIMLSSAGNSQSC